MTERYQCPFCGADGSDGDFECHTAFLGSDADAENPLAFDRSSECYERQIAQQAKLIEELKGVVKEYENPRCTCSRCAQRPFGLYYKKNQPPEPDQWETNDDS